jgi:DNA polymerase III subunit epsilon
MTIRPTTRDTSPAISGFVGMPCDARGVAAPPRCTTPWGRPVAEHDTGWVVLDVETSGFRPGHARVISLAALGLDANGLIDHSVTSLLNPGVDPGPTHVHGLTSEMLAEAPSFADVAAELVDMLHGRTLVAHNVAFDYGFVAAEAELAEIELPVDTVMCTVELTRRLGLGTENLRLETLAAHWGIPQLRPHDALDDALVLSRVLRTAVDQARELDVWLPVRPATRRRWPNGRVTHDELRPLKTVAARVPCPWLNPGRHVPGRPLVQGMRVALSAEVQRTHEELIERIMHAGLAYADMLDPETSLMICNDPNAEHGRGFHARELGVPTMSDAQFMDALDSVLGGASIEEFIDPTIAGEQFSLF